jgi:hypothetical protein
VFTGACEKGGQVLGETVALRLLVLHPRTEHCFVLAIATESFNFFSQRAEKVISF